MAASGYAPWSRVAGIGLMGASETLHDYLDLGPPNVVDSVTAQQYARLAQSVAWIASTAPLAVMSVTGREATAQEPLVVAYTMVDGYATYTGDSPTASFPTVVEQSDGVYRITVDSSYADQAGVSGAFSVATFFAAALDPSSDTFATAARQGATVVDITVTDWSGGTAAPDKSAYVEIG